MYPIYGNIGTLLALTSILLARRMLNSVLRWKDVPSRYLNNVFLSSCLRRTRV